MGSKSQNWEELVQNLKDSGCGSDIIKRYLDCYGCGDSKGEKRIFGKSPEAASGGAAPVSE